MEKNYDKEMNFGINMCMLVFFEYEWGKMKKMIFFNWYNECVIYEYDKILFCFLKGNGF